MGLGGFAIGKSPRPSAGFCQEPSPMRLERKKKMPLTYFVLHNPADDMHHVVYQIPGTNMFSSVACCPDDDLASHFCTMMNGIEGRKESEEAGVKD